MRGEGAAKASMVGGMIGTVVNIVLDPVFILTLNMGTAGAAIATVLGNVCGCIYYVWYFMRRSSMLSIHPRHLRGDKHQMVQVVTIGIPAGVNSALMSIATVLLNNALVQYGDDPVAAMGIVTKAYLFIVFIYMGITNGIQPLLEDLLRRRTAPPLSGYPQIQRYSDRRVRNSAERGVHHFQPSDRRAVH